ncbi:TPA: hypothetical protein ACXE9F_004637 [Pluralibacter gergoviae]
MTIYNGLFEPKKSAIKDGAVPLAIAIDAPNKKVAEGLMTGKLWEFYPANGDNYFKPKVWEHIDGKPCPAVGQFDEQFSQKYTFDGESWVTAEPESAGDHMPGKDEVIDLMKLSSRERFASVLLFSDSPVDGVLYSQVLDYLDNLDNNQEPLDDDDRLNANILAALHNNQPTQHMHVEGLNNLIQAIYANFEEQSAGKAAISQFIKRWLENPGKREEMVPAPQRAESDRPAAAPRGYTHSYATLDQEIALALLPLAPDAPVLSGCLLDAKKIIEDDREDFKRWSMALRTTEQILKYDRPTIFGVVQQVPAKDTCHFPDSLRRYIDSWLQANGRFEGGETKPAPQPKLQVNNLGTGKFSVGELAPGSTSSEGQKTEEPAPKVTESQANEARETLNNMGYGVYATAGSGDEQQGENLGQRAERIADKAEQIAHQVNQQEDAPSAAEVVQSIKDMQAEQDNLTLWKSAFKTDERFTKAFSQNGGGTSINGTYMTMMATREFGPKGIGWGVEILEERFDSGAPITRKVKGADGNSTWELIPDGSGGYLTEKHHVIKIKLWYIRGEDRGMEIAYGCTPYLYDSRYGPICDGEATKKSLTDATKKALSSLGFSADIFLGLYDNPEYRQRTKAEFDLKNASENAEDAARLRQEFDEKLTRNANTLATAVSIRELDAVFAPIAREIEVHRKAAESKGDAERSRYLNGRLRRLTTIKNGRLAELNKAQENA